MPMLAELIEQIEELKPADYDALVQSLSSKRMSEVSAPSGLHAFPSIVATPHVCGGAARFIRTRIPVWTIERMRQLGISEAEMLRSYPTLRAADLVQAWNYVDKHRAEIEQAIQENESE